MATHSWFIEKVGILLNGKKMAYYQKLCLFGMFQTMHLNPKNVSTMFEKYSGTHFCKHLVVEKVMSTL